MTRILQAPTEVISRAPSFLLAHTGRTTSLVMRSPERGRARRVGGECQPGHTCWVRVEAVQCAFSIFVTVKCPFHPRADAASRAVRRYLDAIAPPATLWTSPTRRLTTASSARGGGNNGDHDSRALYGR